MVTLFQFHMSFLFQYCIFYLFFNDLFSYFRIYKNDSLNTLPSDIIIYYILIFFLLYKSNFVHLLLKRLCF
jgi:hypothetical protein